MTAKRWLIISIVLNLVLLAFAAKLIHRDVVRRLDVQVLRAQLRDENRAVVEVIRAGEDPAELIASLRQQECKVLLPSPEVEIYQSVKLVRLVLLEALAGLNTETEADPEPDDGAK